MKKKPAVMPRAFCSDRPRLRHCGEKIPCEPDISKWPRHITLAAALTFAAVGMLSHFSGCGGGASSEPEVVIKPDKASEGGNGAKGESKNDGAAVATGTATLKGKIVYTGPLPKLDPLITKMALAKIKPDDEKVCMPAKMPDDRFLVGTNGGLANVFVYLERAPRGVKVPAPEGEKTRRDFDQEVCRFKPHAMVIRVDGEEVFVVSGDPIPHNTRTSPIRNPLFNEVISPKNRKGLQLPYTKRETAPLKVSCDFHTWMSAYHLPLDHPWAAVTDADGSFEIKDLPAGMDLRFKIWHEAKGEFLDSGYEVKALQNGEQRDVTITYGPDDF